MAPKWYWLVAGLALLWTIAGCASYLAHVTMTPADIAALPPPQRDLMAAQPAWVIAAFAVAVWGALAGAVGLLLRRRWAQPMFAVSLVGVVLQFGWTFLATDLVARAGAWVTLFPAFIFVAGAAMFWFAGHAARRRWLR